MLSFSRNIPWTSEHFSHLNALINLLPPISIADDSLGVRRKEVNSVGFLFKHFLFFLSLPQGGHQEQTGGWLKYL